MRWDNFLAWFLGTQVQEAAKDPEVPDDQRYEGLGVSGYTN